MRLEPEESIIKKCYEAFEKGISGISYKEVLESVKMKDAFKESHKASNCKEIADYVIINDEKKRFGGLLT